jgi:hypothetical protein
MTTMPGTRPGIVVFTIALSRVTLQAFDLNALAPYQA